MVQSFKSIDGVLMKRLQDVVSICADSDGLKGWVSLDASLNAFLEMKSIFVIEEAGEITAFLFLFVPTPEEAEVTAYTLPRFRRKGCFKALLRAAVFEVKKFGINSLLFVCDSASPAAADVMKALDAGCVFTEYKMRYGGGTIASGSSFRLQLSRATEAALDDLTTLSCEVFGDTPENARTFIQKTMIAPNKIQYMARLNGKLAGICCATQTGEETILYGLGITPPLQGKGYGRELLQMLLAELHKQGVHVICLEVNSCNARAFSLYKSCGFEITMANNYYRLKI